MKTKYYYLLSMLFIAMMSVSLMSCGSDDDDSSSSIIPSGTYIEENGHESELFTMVINGYHIKVTISEYGKVWKTFEGTYKISGNTITITMADGTTESDYFSMSGNRVTIGEIHYIKQQ